VWDYKKLRADSSLKGEKLSKVVFVEKQKYERVKLFKVNFYILFYGDNSWFVALRQMKFGTVKDRRHT
jgi:hypothetical protein